jgi:hypothetical protein
MSPSGEDIICWDVIARALMHPVKLQIIEELAQADRPLSPSELHANRQSDQADLTLQAVNYHAESLAKVGVTEVVDTDTPNLGTPAKTFYQLASGART